MEKIMFAASALAVGGLVSYLYIRFMSFVMSKLQKKWRREINDCAQTPNAALNRRAE